MKKLVRIGDAFSNVKFSMHIFSLGGKLGRYWRCFVIFGGGV